MDRIVSASWFNPAARPLPQIYIRNQASQWAWASSYAATHYVCLPQYGIPTNAIGKMVFQGVFATTGPGYLNGGDAWQALWQALNGIQCTIPNLTPTPAQPTPNLRFVTTGGSNLHLP